MLRAGADLWVDLPPNSIVLDPVDPATLGPNITLTCKVGLQLVGCLITWSTSHLVVRWSYVWLAGHISQVGKGRPVPTIEWKRDGITYTGIGVDQGES